MTSGNTGATEHARLSAVPAVSLGATLLSLAALLRREHIRGRLLPWLRQAATDVFLIDQARALGLRVEDAELQHAADVFRRRNQLISAERTSAWLAERQMTQDDFEAVLENDLLQDKLRRHVAADKQVTERFALRPTEYDHLRLRRAIVAREDLAREIVMQVTEEGADFAALSSQHALHARRPNDGAVGVVFRCQVEPSPVREAIKDHKPGDLVGPIAAGEGFHLVQIEEIVPGSMDAQTSAMISRQLFQEWLVEKLAAAPFLVPLLDALRS